jgi:hypothetical protein
VVDSTSIKSEDGRPLHMEETEIVAVLLFFIGHAYLTYFTGAKSEKRVSAYFAYALISTTRCRRALLTRAARSREGAGEPLDLRAPR